MLLAFVFLAPNIAAATDSSVVDGLVAKVGREAVLLSDLRRFRDVGRVLACAKVLVRAEAIPEGRKELLDMYVEEELLYLEARSRKLSTAGLIPQAVHAVHQDPACRDSWQKLGREYSKIYRTEQRVREGESMLVREVEKRLLVDKFRKGESISDGELWRREARARFPVKMYLE